MGDLPSQFASQQAAAGVGNVDACLSFIRPPPEDQQLLRMPKSLCIVEQRIHISRPGQRGLITPHTQQQHAADSQVVTHREGPRSIRIRQREQRAGSQTDSCSRAQLPRQQGPGFPVPNDRLWPVRHLPVQVGRPPVFLTELQVVGPLRPHQTAGLPALRLLPVESCRHWRPDSQQPASRLRSPWSRGCAQPADCFSTADSIRPGRISSTASGHDCSPPMGSTVLPPLRHADIMDTDSPQTQPIVSEAQPMDICAPTHLSGSVRDELMHWMAAHTALSIPRRSDALARLYAAEPLTFSVQPLPQHIYAALRAIDEAETQRQQMLERRQTLPTRERSPAPAIPPGFEARVAARTAVAAAMTGLRRSSRISSGSIDWWTFSQPHSSGRAVSSGRPGQP